MMIHAAILDSLMISQSRKRIRRDLRNQVEIKKTTVIRDTDF